MSGAETSLVWALEASDEQLRLASYGQRGKDLLIETPSSAVGGLGSLLYQVRVRAPGDPCAPRTQRGVPAQSCAPVRLGGAGVLLQVNAESLG